MRRFVQLMIFFLPAVGLAQQPVVFKDHGRVIKSIDLAQLKQLAKPQTVVVRDPHELQKIKFTAIPVNDLFSKIFEDAWNRTEAVVFECADGFKPVIPRDLFRKSRAYLALARADEKTFSLINKTENQIKVPLAPLYLIWTQEPGQPRQEFWPYKLVGVDLQSLANIYPTLAPPKNASANAKAGYHVFLLNCVACHTLNGVGGRGGPELNYPINITEYYREDWLKKWIASPQSVRFGATMPAISISAPQQDKAITDVTAYLQAMAEKKAKPSTAK